MTPRIIFKSDGGEIVFRVKNKDTFETFYHDVAFIAESGLDDVKFQQK